MSYYFTVILTLALLSLFLDLGQSCLYYNTDARKRRAASNEEIVETASVRNYFTACLTDKLGAIENWKDKVDFTILDSMWLKNTLEVSCKADGTAECWQREIGKYVKATKSPTILSAARECIGQYAADSASGVFIYGGKNGRRKKRQAEPTKPIGASIPGFQNLPQYQECLLRELNISQTVDRPQMNFELLAPFIATHLQDPCDVDSPEESDISNSVTEVGNFSEENSNWPYRFVGLTRTNVPLREPLKICARLLYPPNPFWTTWGPWTSCITPGSSLEGRRTRERICRSAQFPRKTSNDCTGAREDFQPCREPFWAAWSPWGVCSSTNSSQIGNRTRQRLCVYGKNTRNHCQGTSIATGICRGPGFGTEYFWGPFEDIGDCRPINGQCYRGRLIGTKRRRRYCYLRHTRKTFRGTVVSNKHITNRRSCVGGIISNNSVEHFLCLLGTCPVA